MKRSSIKIIKYILIPIAAAFFCILSFTAFILIHISNLKEAVPQEISLEQKKTATETFYKKFNFNSKYPPLNSIENFLPVNINSSFKSQDKRNLLKTELPKINAESYILINAKTGTIILEHNADKIIPPASLTKLVTIYTMLQNKEFQNLEKIIKPPKESWARSLPSGTSWMGLGENQHLSIRELITGMAVCSGNDAALAAAILCDGSLQNFTQKMNELVKSMGLKMSSFEDSSGLSEKNKTTAKDFALFSLHYINLYPENLKNFHSITEISYPQKHNIIAKKNNSKSQYFQITKPATNTLLKKIEGCDGLKTGFIYESGFNISLTAEKDGERFIAIILGGKGNNFTEGISVREENSIKIMNFAFDNFASFNINEHNKIKKSVKVLGSNINAKNSAIVPIIANLDFSPDYISIYKKDKENVEQIVNLPETLTAPVFAGQKIGSIEYRIKDSNIILKSIPLISPVNIKEGSILRKFFDKFYIKIIK